MNILLKRQTMKNASFYFVSLCLSIAVVVLSGWLFDVDFLKRPIPGLATMNPTAALCFILSSICFLILHFNCHKLRWVAYGLAGFTLSVALIRIIGEFDPTIISIDRILFNEAIRLEETEAFKNRMSLNGAINFVFASLSLLLLQRKEGAIILSQVLSVLIGLIAWFAVIGYAYRVPEFYGLLSYLPMALHTAFCFILLSLALLFFHPKTGIPKEIFSSEMGGRVARVLFPILLICPFILGYFRLLAHWHRLISTEFGVSLLVVTITVLFALTVFVSIVLLNRQDRKQKAQADELLALNRSIKEVNEEMVAVNEEFVASNEELNAANEELSTLNETLQLANEKIREQADTIVSQKDEQLNRALESTDIIIWSIDLTGEGKDYVSRTMERMTGLSPDAFIANRSEWFKMIVPEDMPKRDQVLKELDERGEVKSTFRFYTKGGSVRWFETQVHLVRNENGDNIREEGIASDITTLKRSEAILAQERNLLRSLIDNVPDYIFIKNRSLQHILDNKANAELIREARKAAENNGVSSNFFGEQALAFEEDDRKVLAGESVINKEEKIITPSKERTLLTTKVPLRDLSGEVIGVIGISRDVTEAKERETLLNRYRENLDIIFRSTWEEILLLDHEGKVVLFNDALERFITQATGKRPVIGNYLWDTTMPERNETARSLFLHALNGRATTTEAFIKTPEGIKVHELRYQPVYADGKVKYVMLISLDITERKNQEASLRESEANLRAIFNTTGDAFILLDKDFNTRAFNESFKRSIFQWRGEKLKLGVNILAIIQEQRVEIFRDYLNRAKAGDNIEYEIQSSDDNQTAWFHVVISPVKDEHQDVIGLCITSHDLTIHKKAELEIRENEERFRAIIENSEDFFVISKPDGIPTYISSNVVKFLGYTSEELKIKPFETIPQHEENNYLKVLTESLQRPGEILPVLQRVRHKEGHLLWMEGTIINLISLSSVNGLVATFRDVTTRKRYEEEKNEMVRQLVNNNNDLLQFSFIASHNLRGPVASMMGLLNLFKREGLDEEAAHLLQLIDRSVARLDAVIHDLSFILEMRNDEIHSKENVKLTEITDEIKVALALQIAESKAKIIINDKVKSFYTIKSYFYSILYNLVSNAIKYRSSERSPVITISSLRTENSVGLKIEDNGMGIDMAKFKDKLFMLYQRFHLEVEGKGIGLYLVKTQTHTLNGSVYVESEPGKGTVFLLTFNGQSPREKQEL